MTSGEVFSLIIGITIGAATCGIAGLLRRRVRHAVALRNAQIKHREDLAEKRARHLRSRTKQITGKNGWELDVETVYAALFSENGFDKRAGKHPRNARKEQSKRDS